MHSFTVLDNAFSLEVSRCGGNSSEAHSEITLCGLEAGPGDLCLDVSAAAQLSVAKAVRHDLQLELLSMRFAFCD